MQTDQFTTLIQASDLKEILDRNSTVVIDVRFSLADPNEGSKLYAEGHIPGTRYLHLDNDLSGDITPSTGRHPLPEADSFAKVLGRCGVDQDTQIVAYDHGPGAIAGRLWWLCKWLGHEQVAVLDGGMAAWQALGFPIDQVPSSPRSGDFQAQVREDLHVTTTALEQALRDGHIELFDARAPGRFRGEAEPLDKVAGHIPGAQNLPFTDNLADDGTFLPAARLAERHASGGNVIHMCGSGVTACHNILATLVAGHAMPKLYAGSWSEWITDSGRAVAKDD